MAPVREFIDFFLRNKGLGILLVLGLVAGIAGPTLFRGAILPTKRTDLTVYLRAGEAVLDNHAREIYSVANVRHWHYIYPPLLAILLAPVSKASPLATVPLAYLLSLACLAGTAVLSLRFPEDARPAPWQIALAMIFCLPMFLNTLTRGQFDIITLFLMAAIFYNHLKKKKLVTGLLLAFAVTLKVSPLAFLLFFFLMKREWKILWSALLGFVLFFFLLPSAAIGWNTNGALLKIWWGLMSISQSDTAYRHYLWNELYSPFGPHHQSIYSVVTRLAWPSETQFLGRSNRTVRIITSCLSALLLTLPFLKARGTAPGEKRSALKQLAEF